MIFVLPGMGATSAMYAGPWRDLVARIHGKRDPFITCPKDCEIIKKGAHVIAYTHPQECVEFVRKHVDR